MSDYKVIWFDDEFRTLHWIREKAMLQGIELVGFDNAEEGIEELNYNIENYDAAIVDGIFFKRAGSKGEAFDDSALFDVGMALEKMADKKKLPWFILSGQTSFTNEENPFAKSFKNNKVYDKMNDLEELLSDLKDEANKLPETQARLQYPTIFKNFSSGIIDKRAEKLFLDIVISINEKNYEKKNILVQRDLLEIVFKSLNNPIPFLYDSFFDERLNNKPNHEWCVRFIEGKPTSGYDGKEHKLNKKLPRDIQSSFRKLKESVNKYSHDSINSEIKFPFLANSYLIMEILNWLPEFVEDNFENYIQ